MSAFLILGLTIIAGTVIGLGVLQIAHELIIRGVHSAPLTGDESIRRSGTVQNDAATRRQQPVDTPPIAMHAYTPPRSIQESPSPGSFG